MSSQEFFRVDASLMQHLGASLISDDLQCLAELVKNAYDADARTVKITIDAPDRIVVEDDGSGMDAETIRRGWLTVSNSLKAEHKRAGLLTPMHHRTPLGDKGLGRLSTQRLGRHLRIESVARSSGRCVTAEIDWTAFVPGADIASIPVVLEDLPADGRKVGTRIIVSELVTPQDWQSLDPSRLRGALSSMVSPYEEVANFRLQAFLNGAEVTPSLIPANLRAAAPQTFGIEFDGTTMRITGRLMLTTFRGVGRTSVETFQRYLEADSGQAFMDHLLRSHKTRDYRLARPQEGRYFVEFACQRDFADIVATTRASSPGPFQGEVDSFSMDSLSVAGMLKETPALSSFADAKRLVKDLSGIRVYRDGFVVKTDHDWLHLGEGQTSGGSYYGLRPWNTMGYVAISAMRNAALRETTDRQGFVDDAHYRGFHLILMAFRDLVNQILASLRRARNDFVKERVATDANLQTRDPKVIEARIAGVFRSVSAVQETLQQTARLIDESTSARSGSLFPEDPATVAMLDRAQQLLSRASGVLDTVSTNAGLPRVLVDELDALSQRIGEVYELVSLGITAEALSHDIAVILERLSVETNTIQKHARVLGLNDARVLRFFEVVRSTVSSLEKQLGHLDPALRYTREKRVVFAISELLREASPYYQTRLEPSRIDMEITYSHDFTVYMNKGKLIQVLDNLILNSEYWVKVALGSADLRGKISIEVVAPQVIVQDSGRGVEPAFEETLFDPFVTSKPSGEGRGLGLFIARQLLELDGCNMHLLADRNSLGRRYRIAISLEGAVHHG